MTATKQRALNMCHLLPSFECGLGDVKLVLPSDSQQSRSRGTGQSLVHFSDRRDYGDSAWASAVVATTTESSVSMESEQWPDRA